MLCELLESEQSGDSRRVAETLKLMIGVCCHIAETSDYSVSKYIGRLRLQKVGTEFIRILGTSEIELTDGDLNEFRDLFNAAWIQTESSAGFDSAISADLIQRVYTDDGDGNGHMTRIGMELMCNLDYGAMWIDHTSVQHPLAFIAFSPSSDSVTSAARLRFDAPFDCDSGANCSAARSCIACGRLARKAID